MLSIKEIKEKRRRGEPLTKEEKLHLLKKPKLSTPKMKLRAELKKKEIEDIARRNPGKDANKLYNLLHRAKVKNRAGRRFKRGLHRKTLDRAAARS